MFPDINLTSAGNSYASQNASIGTFYGHIKDMRPIKSEKTPTCFAVIEIEVEGDPQPFQLYLNYNGSEDKAQKSLDYLVSKIKELATACGKQTDLTAVRDKNWLETTTKALVNEHCNLWFRQYRSKQGLEIDFLAKKPQNVTDGVAQW